MIFTDIVFYVNETVDIPYTVTNMGNQEQDIDVRIEDDMQFALDLKIQSYTIKPGQNESGHFTIRAGPTPWVTT